MDWSLNYLNKFPIISFHFSPFIYQALLSKNYSSNNIFFLFVFSMVDLSDGIDILKLGRYGLDR